MIKPESARAGDVRHVVTKNTLFVAASLTIKELRVAFQILLIQSAHACRFVDIASFDERNLNQPPRNEDINIER